MIGYLAYVFIAIWIGKIAATHGRNKIAFAILGLFTSLGVGLLSVVLIATIVYSMGIDAEDYELTLSIIALIVSTIWAVILRKILLSSWSSNQKESLLDHLNE